MRKPLAASAPLAPATAFTYALLWARPGEATTATLRSA
jgi:hypothetical protein